MHFLFVLLTLTYPYQNTRGTILEAVGDVACANSSLIMDFSTSPLHTDGAYVSELRVTKAVEGGMDHHIFSPRVLWSGTPERRFKGHVQGKIGILPLADQGWVSVASSLMGVPSSLIVWSGATDLCDYAGKPISTDLDTQVPNVDVNFVDCVRLENVRVDDKIPLSGYLDSPSIFSWGGALRLIGTSSPVGYDPKHDWGSKRVIWLATFQDRESISTVCKGSLLTEADHPKASGGNELLPMKVTALAAMRIGSGAFPSVIAAKDSVIMAYWDGAGEYLVDQRHPVRFLVSKDLKDWSESAELPPSLEVGTRFTVTGLPDSIVIVSYDHNGDKKFHLQSMTSEGWRDSLIRTIEVDDIASNIPFSARSIGARRIEIRWSTSAGLSRSDVTVY